MSAQAAKFLYVIGSDAGHHKVGVSTNPKYRLAQLQTASPMRLALVHVTPEPLGEADKVEAYAHWILRESRLSGEWFQVTDEAARVAITAAIEAVRSGLEVPSEQRTEHVSTPMPGEHFAAWVALMRSNGWTKAECAKRLGCGVNQINVWSAKGAPPYIALACSALCQGLPPWRKPAP